MKNKILLALAACVALAACNKQENAPESLQFPAEEQGMGSISLSIDGDFAQTKAIPGSKDGSFNTETDAEKAVKTIQALVFDEAKRVVAYKSFTSATGMSIDCTAGSRTVWMVLNFPTDLSAVKTEDQLKATAASLDSHTAANGFVMTGSASCTIQKGQTASCEVSVNRLVSRITVSHIYNELPSGLGSITINDIFLSNVVANQNLAGTAAITTWYNLYGRSTGSTSKNDIINGTDHLASCPDLTFVKPASAVTIAHGAKHGSGGQYKFYTMPNATKTALGAWSATPSAQPATIVIDATIDGSHYYYPVPLTTYVPERNKSIDVDIVITGPGSSDPNASVEKGALSVTVKVVPWTLAASYNEII